MANRVENNCQAANQGHQEDGRRQHTECFPHKRNAATEHCLDRIANQRLFYGNDKIDKLQVLLQPTLDTSRQLIHALQNQRTL